MKIKIFFFLLFIFPVAEKTFAQDSLQRYHGMFVEAGGNGGVYSIDYQNKLFFVRHHPVLWIAGFSAIPISSRTIVSFPVTAKIILGKGKHKAEFATGQMLALSLGGGKGGTIRGTFSLGYRFEPENKRYFLEAAYTPFYSYIQNFQFNNWFGFSFGRYFKK